MTFYARGRKEKNFEAGVTKALEAILASPQFLFRVEEHLAPADATAQLSPRAITSSRRGCRSSSGAAGPMRSC